MVTRGRLAVATVIATAVFFSAAVIVRLDLNFRKPSSSDIIIFTLLPPTSTIRTEGGADGFFLRSLAVGRSSVAGITR